MELDTGFLTIKACKSKEITDSMVNVSVLTRMMEEGLVGSLHVAYGALKELRELLNGTQGEPLSMPVEN